MQSILYYWGARWHQMRWNETREHICGVILETWKKRRPFIFGYIGRCLLFGVCPTCKLFAFQWGKFWWHYLICIMPKSSVYKSSSALLTGVTDHFLLPYKGHLSTSEFAFSFKASAVFVQSPMWRLTHFSQAYTGM